MPNKLYYLSAEIAPFCGTYSLAEFSRAFSIYIHEQVDMDIRLAQPKYGFVSERKYILREVIRLKDMPVKIAGCDVMACMKSAFIPESRAQVYFVESEEHFKGLPELLYKARNGRVYKNNDEKFGFFTKVVVESLNNLYWAPDVIMCNDWPMALVPAYLKQKRANSEFYANCKSIFMLHSLNDSFSVASKQALSDVGLNVEDADDKINVYEYALKNCNHCIVLDNENENIMKQINADAALREAFEAVPNNVFQLDEEAGFSERKAIFKEIVKVINGVVS